MNTTELEAKLDELLRLDAETEWVEFKEAKTDFQFDDLGKYFVALCNEANLKNKEAGWLVFGVKDKPRQIVGTQFRPQRPNLEKLKHEISCHTTGHITFREIHEVQRPEGRVVIFEIPAAPQGIPVEWRGHYYGRNGESLYALSLLELEQIRGQRPHFKPGLWVFVLILVGSFLAIQSGVLHLKSLPSFFVSMSLQSFQMPPNQWFIYENGYGPKRIKVAGAGLVEFTNLRKVPIMLAAYAVEIQSTNGEWRTAETVYSPATGANVFIGGDLKHMTQVKYTTFESAIRDKNIAPNETVRGWVVFKEMPHPQLRLKVNDTTGHILVEPFEAALKLEVNPSGGELRGLPVQSPLMEMIGNVDISAVPEQ